jgi:hypothetical protein
MIYNIFGVCQPSCFGIIAMLRGDHQRISENSQVTVDQRIRSKMPVAARLPGQPQRRRYTDAASDGWAAATTPKDLDLWSG